jgi:hypothetical protein
MSILSKWGFRGENRGGSVYAPYRYLQYLSRSSGYIPEAVANPLTPNNATFPGTLRDEPAAGWRVVKTRRDLVEERMAFESWAAREMTRPPAVAEVREEIIQD